MDIGSLIGSQMGQAALAQVGARLGLSPEMTRMAAAALAPALAGGMAKAAAGGGLSPAPAEPGTDEARLHGNDVLGQVLGSKNASRSVATDAAQRTGLDVGTLKQLLPQIASMAASAHGGLGGQGGLLGGMGR